MKFAEFREKHYLQGYELGQKALQENILMLFEAIDNKNLEQLSFLLPYCNTKMLREAEQRVGHPQLSNFDIRLAIKHRWQELESNPPTHPKFPIGSISESILEAGHDRKPMATRYVGFSRN